MHCPFDWPEYELQALLTRIVRSQMHRFHAMVSELGLQRGQPAILMRLAHKEGVAQAELAVSLCIRPASVTHSLQRLEAAGLVRRVDDANDQRISRVYLTPAGRDLAQPLQETMQMLTEHAFAGFEENETVTFRSYLERIAANLDALDARQE